MKLKILFLSLFISFKVFALVDYSETVSSSEEKNPVNNSYTKMNKVSNSSQSNSRSLTWKADYSLATNYESLEISGEKFGVMNVGFHLQTPFNVFFDASYWHAQGQLDSSSGNPKMIIGFNWLRFGNPSEEARLDFYGGAKLATDSRLGSSRFDKIVGVETTKRFGSFGLGIGYDLILVGLPKDEIEKSIGNISRIVFSGGWMVSNDIQFEVEVENFTISPDKSSNRTNHLSEKVQFSTLSPKLNLGLAQAVNLEFGARFRIKKAKEEANLMNARVFELHGANANSLFAGLNFTI